MAKYRQGFFKPRNPSKYKGDPTKIIYRSGWELRMMMHFDSHQDVIWWQSEELVIPYRSPIDGKIHRYFPDFVIRTKTKDGKFETVMVEVKPLAQTKEPKKQSKITQSYIREAFNWGINSAKWEMAEAFCKERGWKFLKMTEKEIYGKKL
jgi:hypothetical protein